MSCSDIREYLETTHNKEVVFLNPTEVQASTKLKCTVVVRIMNFIILILQDGTSRTSDVLDSLLTPGFFKMILLCVIDPQKVGFDIKDLEVAKNLPKCLEEMLKVLADKAPERFSLAFTSILEKELESPQHDIISSLPSSLSESSSVSVPSKQFLDGLQLLQKTRWLSKCSLVSEIFACYIF